MNDTTAIKAVLVAPDKRLDFLPRYFGRDMMRVENAVYNAMTRLCSAYHGGYWNFYELSNGGAYLGFTGPAVTLLVEGNGFEGRLSADAAGLVATLFALSSLSFKFQGNPRYAERYHQLRDYAAHHPESALIFRAID